jgi:hypothetical protein
MMHVTYGEKAVFMDDEVAEVLFDYAARLADAGRADTVTLNAVGPDGHKVRATYLLNQGTVLVRETADATLVVPDNSEAIAYMRDKMKGLGRTHIVEPMTPEELAEIRDFGSIH